MVWSFWQFSLRSNFSWNKTIHYNKASFFWCNWHLVQSFISRIQLRFSHVLLFLITDLKVVPVSLFRIRQHNFTVQCKWCKFRFIVCWRTWMWLQSRNQATQFYWTQVIGFDTNWQKQKVTTLVLFNWKWDDIIGSQHYVVRSHGEVKSIFRIDLAIL